MNVPQRAVPSCSACTFFPSHVLIIISVIIVVQFFKQLQHPPLLLLYTSTHASQHRVLLTTASWDQLYSYPLYGSANFFFHVSVLKLFFCYREKFKRPVNHGENIACKLCHYYYYNFLFLVALSILPLPPQKILSRANNLTYHKRGLSILTR